MATKKRSTKKAEKAPEPAPAAPEPKPVAIERPTINTRKGKVEAGRDFSGLDYPIHLEHEEWTVSRLDDDGNESQVPRGVTAHDAGELEGYLRVGYRVKS